MSRNEGSVNGALRPGRNSRAQQMLRKRSALCPYDSKFELALLLTTGKVTRCSPTKFMILFTTSNSPVIFFLALRAGDSVLGDRSSKVDEVYKVDRVDSVDSVDNVDRVDRVDRVNRVDKVDRVHVNNLGARYSRSPFFFIASSKFETLSAGNCLSVIE